MKASRVLLATAIIMASAIILSVGPVQHVRADNTLPSSFDWRDSGIMTSVKNQGNEGYCVAYAVVGAFEADIRLHGGINADDQPHFSPENLYWDVSNLHGGLVTATFCLQYLQQYGVPESTTGDTYKVSGWVALGYIGGNTTLIKNDLVGNGPLIAGFQAYNDFVIGYKPSWDNYGVYHPDENTGVAGGHQIVIVGYRDNENCWIIKNSWGPTWNGDGYFKFAYDSEPNVGIEYGYVYSITGFTTQSAPPTDNTPPAAPQLSSPGDNSSTTNTRPTFSWSAVSDNAPVTYRIQVSANLLFTSPIESVAPISGTSYTSSALSVGTYYWRVQATDGAGNTGAFSIPYSIQIKSRPIRTGGSSIPAPTPAPQTPTSKPSGGISADEIIIIGAVVVILIRFR